MNVCTHMLREKPWDFAGAALRTANKCAPISPSARLTRRGVREGTVDGSSAAVNEFISEYPDNWALIDGSIALPPGFDQQLGDRSRMIHETT